jgi:hypothetical protein
VNSKLTVQAVSGIIRATKGINYSQKYSAGKLTRSFGVYAEVERFSNQIVVGFETGNLSNTKTQKAEQLAKVFENLTVKGFKVVEKSEPAFYGSSVLETKYVIEIAE